MSNNGKVKMALLFRYAFKTINHVNCNCLRSKGKPSGYSVLRRIGEGNYFTYFAKFPIAKKWKLKEDTHFSLYFAKIFHNAKNDL